MLEEAADRDVASGSSNSNSQESVGGVPGAKSRDHKGAGGNKNDEDDDGAENGEDDERQDIQESDAEEERERQKAAEQGVGGLVEKRNFRSAGKAEAPSSHHSDPRARTAHKSVGASTTTDVVEHPSTAETALASLVHGAADKRKPGDVNDPATAQPPHGNLDSDAVAKKSVSRTWRHARKNADFVADMADEAAQDQPIKIANERFVRDEREKREREKKQAKAEAAWSASSSQGHSSQPVPGKNASDYLAKMNTTSSASKNMREQSSTTSKNTGLSFAELNSVALDASTSRRVDSIPTGGEGATPPPRPAEYYLSAQARRYQALALAALEEQREQALGASASAEETSFLQTLKGSGKGSSSPTKGSGKGAGAPAAHHLHTARTISGQLLYDTCRKSTYGRLMPVQFTQEKDEIMRQFCPVKCVVAATAGIYGAGPKAR